MSVPAPPRATIRAVALPPPAADRAYLEQGMAALQDVERAIEPNRLPGPAMAAPHVAALLQEAAASEGLVLIAENADGPCAFLFALVEEAFGTVVDPRNRRLAVISDLWIEPDARGTGLVEALIARAEAHASAAGLARIEVSALWLNARAQAAYRKAGFAPSLVTFAKAL
ncbi:MAG: GNAT family N-acetyltransferase [Pseudomonadota bacterium]